MISGIYESDIYEHPIESLLIDLVDDRGGRPLSIFELEEDANNFLQTARIIVALSRVLSRPYNTDRYIVKRFRQIVARTTTRESRSFNDIELSWLLRVTNTPRWIGADDTLELSVAFLGAVYTNPTKISWMVAGAFLPITIGAVVWAGVNINHQVHSQGCIARSKEFADESRRLLTEQARREGRQTKELTESINNVSQILLAATESCTRIIGMPSLKASLPEKIIEAKLQ